MRKNKNMIGVREAAALMNVFPTYVLTLIYGRKIAAEKYGRKWMLLRRDVEEYAARLDRKRRGSAA